MLKNWTESEATWRKPCEACDPWWQGWSQGNYASSPTFSQQVTGKNQWFDWDVTGDIKVFLEGTSNHGWFLKSAETAGTDSTSANFYSKESNNPTLRPYLQIRYISTLPPPLTVKITSPTDGTAVNASPLTVTGTMSDPTATVTVNGIASSISDNTFQASIDLAEGQNTITAQATDQYGQTATDSVTVTLLTKGTIAGTVTDSQSGLPLSSATVSVTDALSVTQTALTGADGDLRDFERGLREFQREHNEGWLCILSHFRDYVPGRDRYNQCCLESHLSHDQQRGGERNYIGFSDDFLGHRSTGRQQSGLWGDCIVWKLCVGFHSDNGPRGYLDRISPQHNLPFQGHFNECIRFFLFFGRWYFPYPGAARAYRFEHRLP